jgi:hypothetical protein
MMLMTLSFAAHSQSLNTNWKQDLTNAMKTFLDCQDTLNNNIGCSKFLGESLHIVYRVNDFYSQKTGRYMVAAEIASFLKSSNQWKLLGPSYDQKTLTQAQEHANAKKAVVAVYTSTSGSSHVVLINPGVLQSSGSWGLSVPTATSFLLSQPDRSFVDKGLSFAFGKLLMKDVSIYARNY